MYMPRSGKYAPQGGLGHGSMIQKTLCDIKNKDIRKMNINITNVEKYNIYLHLTLRFLTFIFPL